MNRSISFLISLLFATTTFLATSSAQAAGCQGQSQVACSADSLCKWVEASTSEEGTAVTGHCSVVAAAKSAVSDGQMKARGVHDKARHEATHTKKGAEMQAEKANKMAMDKVEKAERGRSDPQGKAMGHDMDKAEKKAAKKAARKTEREASKADRAATKKATSAQRDSEKAAKKAEKKASKGMSDLQGKMNEATDAVDQ